MWEVGEGPGKPSEKVGRGLREASPLGRYMPYETKCLGVLLFITEYTPDVCAALAAEC